jgi:hypothetical protein
MHVSVVFALLVKARSGVAAGRDHGTVRGVEALTAVN